jgi:hypothetical protein
MIEATRTAPGVVEAAGIEVKHRAPTLALCRALLAAGHADQRMVVYDTDGRALMTVHSIAEAAGVTVHENDKVGPKFAKWSPFVRDNIDARGVAVAPGSREGDDLGDDGGESN